MILTVIEFDLNGNLTTTLQRVGKRQQWRKEYFFDPLVELLGGSLEGKRVLDLACSAGFWSLCAIEEGCDYVLGIDGRQMHVDQATFVFEVKEVEKSRYDFIKSDIFAADLTQFGAFDVVLCPGLMYHISKHVELMEKISEVNSDLLMIDTTLADIPGSAMRIWHDNKERHNAAVDYELVMTPTREAVRDLAQQFGYSVSVLKPNFGTRGGVRDWAGVRDYWIQRRTDAKRRAFICAKHTDIGRLPAETEPIERSVLPARRLKPDGRRWSGQHRPLHSRISKEGNAKQVEDDAQRLIEQMDVVLSELFASRRWKLANALVATLQVLGKARYPATEDRLRELKGEFRALLRESSRVRSKKGT